MNIHYPFKVGIEEAKKIVGAALPTDYRNIKSYHSGDHWQNGRAWIGPMPKEGEDGYEDAMAEIVKAFTSHNMVAEVVERHMMGIMGREPNWSFTPRRAMKLDERPTDEEQRLIDEVEELMTQWWDERGIQQALQDTISTALWSSLGPARLYVPKGLLTTIGKRGDGSEVKAIMAGDMREALDLVYMKHHAPDTCTVYTDPDSMKDLGVYLYKDDEGNDWAELAWTDGEVTWLEIVSHNQSGNYRLDYGGRIPMFVISRRSLITTQVLQNQRALNLALSMNPRNIVTGGFLERILLNAQMPGEWEHDDEGNRTRFVPDEYHTGAGSTSFLRGIDYTDEDGKTHVATPNVHFREPTDVQPAIDASDIHQLKILEEVDQAHVLTTSSQYQSGKSKEQARADFMASLNLTRNPADQFGRWVLDTALAMAEQFSGQSGKYTESLRAVFSSKPDYGPLTFEERRQYNEAMEKGVLSRQRNMHLQGIDDVDAELAQINSERLGTLEMTEKQLGILNSALNAGLPPEVAARKAGFEETEVAEIAAGIEAERERQAAEAERQAAARGTPPTD